MFRSTHHALLSTYKKNIPNVIPTQSRGGIVLTFLLLLDILLLSFCFALIISYFPFYLFLIF